MILSAGTTFSAGEVMTFPFTATRPASISFSASRREARPERAMTLAMRSPGGDVSDMAVSYPAPSPEESRLSDACARGITGAMTFRSHMDRALTEARAAAARGEVPVGAVVVAPDGRVLAAAGNRTRELADPTAHAELLAIREAARAWAPNASPAATST